MVWIKPERLIFGNSFWHIERANPYFVLQRRKGHNIGPPTDNSSRDQRKQSAQQKQLNRSTSLAAGTSRSSSGGGGLGLGALFVSTIDSIFDTRPPPFRILYQRDFEDGQISFVIAIAVEWAEIVTNWECLERTVLPILGSLDNEEDLEKFVLNKVEGLMAIKEKETTTTNTTTNVNTTTTTTTKTMTTTATGAAAIAATDDAQKQQQQQQMQNQQTLQQQLEAEEEEDEVVEQVTKAAILQKFQKLFNQIGRAHV